MSDDVSSRNFGLEWTQAEVREFVANCYDRDANLATLMGYAAGWMTGRLIVVVGRSALQPYFAAGWEKEFQRDTLKGVRVPFEDSIEEAQIVGPDRFASLFEALEMENPERVGVVPVPIGGRTAMMLVGQVEGNDLGPLSDVATQIGDQLENLIRLTKTGKLPPEDRRIPEPPRRISHVSESSESSEAFPEMSEPSVGKASDSWVASQVFEALEHSSGASIGTEENRHRSTIRLTEESLAEASSDAVRETIQLEPESLNEGSDPRSTQELDAHTPGSDTFAGPSMSMRPHEESEAPSTSASATTFGLPLTQGDVAALVEANKNASNASEVPSEISDVAVFPPKEISEVESKSTLMGGISVEAGMIQDSMTPPPTIQKPSEASTTQPGGIEAPKSSGRIVPGAAIFKPRKKSKKVGKFMPSKSRTDRKPVQPKPEKEKKRQTSVVAIDSNKDKQQPPREDTVPPAKGNDTNPEPPPSTNLVGNHPSTPIAEEWVDFFGDSTMGKQPNGAEEPPTVKRKNNFAPPPPKKPETEPVFDDDIIVSAPEESELDPSVFDGLEPDSGNQHQIPQGAMEALLGAGPSVIEYQESFLLLDSRDKQTAFKAADDVAALGIKALDIVEMMFPGRIFVDRYQYTVDTLPAVEEHSPVLSVLVRIGSEASHIPVKYLDHKSNETRFYAILALTALDPTGFLDHVYERLFDKDVQIRNMAKKILVRYRNARDFAPLVTELRDEIERGREDMRVEIAADMVAELKDRESISLLIDMLGQYGARTNQRVHAALQKLTLKSWSSPYEWKHWWQNAKDEPRDNWLVDALDAQHEETRRQAFYEIQRIPGLNLHYHFDQPAKLRRRAQRELRAWFEEQPEDD